MASVTTHLLPEEAIARLRRVYDSFKEGQSFVRTEPGNVILHAPYEKIKDRLKNWQVRPEDVYVLAFPKTGTTWTKELVWLLQNDCNIEGAQSTPISVRFPWIEADIISEGIRNRLDSLKQLHLIQNLEKMPSPRMLQTHLHFCLLPDDFKEKSKIVLCLRNPKDTVVSYYYFEKLFKMSGYTGDFETYFNLFMDNLVPYSSYFDFVIEAWAKRNHPNVCLLFFEDMKKDLATNVKRVAKFFGKELTNENVEALVDHLSFKKMKHNPGVNREDMKVIQVFREDGNFMRKGEIGDWKNHFTEEMNIRMDKAIEKYFKPIGLEFQYE